MNRLRGSVGNVLASIALGLLATFAAGFAAGRQTAAAPKPDPARDPALDKLGHEKLFESMLATAGGAIDRARSGAQWIETAAAAIIGIYTGIFGALFVVGTNPLPVRGIVPAIFLAASIVLAAFYLAFLTKGKDVGMPLIDVVPDSARRLQAHVSNYVEWISASVMNRREFLRGAVVSLAFGVLLLPLPFISVPDQWAVYLPGTFEVQDQTGEEAATNDDNLLVLPDPQQFTEEIPVELAEIAYQARVDAFVKASNQAPARNDDAENLFTIYLTGVGVAAVLLTMLGPWLWRELGPVRR